MNRKAVAGMVVVLGVLVVLLQREENRGTFDVVEKAHVLAGLKQRNERSRCLP